MRVKNCKGHVRGECHPRSKLSDADCDLMIHLHDEYGMGYKRLAKKFECHRNTARQICNGSRRSVVSVGDS